MTLSDAIEAFLKERLGTQGSELSVRRVGVAERFGCAPSQVTYVLSTRFRPERGYAVESHRGGGGYVRIRRLRHARLAEATARVAEVGQVTQRQALGLAQQLVDAGDLSVREAAMLMAAMDRDVLGLPLPARDLVRARILQAMLRALACE